MSTLFGTYFMKRLPQISRPPSVCGFTNLCFKLTGCASESTTSEVRSHYFSKCQSTWATSNIWQSLSSNAKLFSTVNARSIPMFNLQMGLKDISCDGNFCASNAISVLSYFSQDFMLSMAASAYANIGNLSVDATPTTTSTSRLFLAQIWTLTFYYSYVLEIFMKVYKLIVNHVNHLCFQPKSTMADQNFGKSILKVCRDYNKSGHAILVLLHLISHVFDLAKSRIQSAYLAIAIVDSCGMNFQDEVPRGGPNLLESSLQLWAFGTLPDFTDLKPTPQK